MKYRETFTLVTFIIIFLTYNTIGYILDIDTLKVIVPNENQGITINFVALLVPIIISYLIYYFTNKIKQK